MTELKGIIVFDMDGTIADLYSVENWLADLRSENARPYKEAKPIWDMEALSIVLRFLQNDGYKVVVTSWLSKGSSREYDKEVRKAKREWLEKFDFPFDEIHLVKYGTTKANCTRKYKVPQILIDDNDSVRKGWTLGSTINPVETDIITELIKLLYK